MLQGMATLSLYAEDVRAAAEWYSEVLGFPPYYEVPGPSGAPAYVEWRVGDFEHELGVIDARYRPDPALTGGPLVYWHVDDLPAAVDRLVGLGASPHQPITPRGTEGTFVTASVVDPFGNVLGLMTNPHFAELRSRLGGARVGPRNG